MGASAFPDVDLEAALVVLIFDAGIVLAAAVLLKQTADSVRFSLGGPPFTLLISRVVHGRHSSRVVTTPSASITSTTCARSCLGNEPVSDR